MPETVLTSTCMLWYIGAHIYIHTSKHTKLPSKQIIPIG